MLSVIWCDTTTASKKKQQVTTHNHKKCTNNIKVSYGRNKYKSLQWNVCTLIFSVQRSKKYNCIEQKSEKEKQIAQKQKVLGVSTEKNEPNKKDRRKSWTYKSKIQTYDDMCMCEVMRSRATSYMAK